MIKLSKVTSLKTNAPSLILIPGGPGLSSLTLKSLDILSRSFHLYYVDFPGTNNNPYVKKNTFEELSLSLKDELQKIKGRKFVLGHSYGGFFAAKLALDMSIDGIICASTPFSQKSLLCVSTNYTSKKTQTLMNAEVNWIKNQDDNSFAEWLSEYGQLYFVKPEGRELLLNDNVSSIFYLDNRSDVLEMGQLPLDLKNNSVKKLFIAGEMDGLISKECAREEAQSGNFEFVSVENASHFVTYDQADKVACLIEKFSDDI